MIKWSKKASSQETMQDVIALSKLPKDRRAGAVALYLMLFLGMRSFYPIPGSKLQQR